MKPRIEKPIFLVGCMRSGTTMLAELLGRHPNIIHCPFELRGLWSNEGKVPMASPKTLDQKCPHLTEEDVKPGQAKRLERAFLAEMKKNKGNKNIKDAVFLNKNPHLGNKLPFVNALFPDARFIWIYRDMPSVTASLKKILNKNVFHYWPKQKDQESVRCWECLFNGIPESVNSRRCFPGGDVKFLAEYWYETNRAISEFSKKIPAERIFLIKEEELIKNPEKVLTECQSFLGLPINLPKKLIAKIDRNRNELWSKRLSKCELNSLLKFVQDCGETLDSIFPEQDLFIKYKEQIASELQ
jgi:hypothetical protein